MNEEMTLNPELEAKIRAALDVGEVPKHIASAIHKAANSEWHAQKRRRRYFRPQAFHFVATAAAAMIICALTLTQYRAMQTSTKLQAATNRTRDLLALTTLDAEQRDDSANGFFDAALFFNADWLDDDESTIQTEAPAVLSAEGECKSVNDELHRAIWL